MFPQIEINLNELEEKEQLAESKELGFVPAFNFKTGQTIIKDGKPVYIDEIESIKQWIIFLLKTELNKFKIYLNTSFGVTFIDLIGQKQLPQGFINSEIKRQVEEKIKLNRRISKVQNFKIKKIKDILKVEFTTVLVNENRIKSEVKFIV